MKKFKYKAKKSSAETIEGVLVAQTRDDAIDQINAIGLLPVDIEEEREANQKSSPKFWIRKKVSAQMRAVFYRQLAKLIKSGVPILRSIEIVSEQTSHAYFQDILNYIQTEVRQGSRFSEALLRYPKVFSAFDVAMIQTGESVGHLDEALNRMGSYLEQQEMVSSKIRTATAYPIFVMVIGVISVFVMLTFVIPKFVVFFEDLGQELPLATRILIDASEWSKTGWIWILLGLIGIWMFIRYLNASPARKKGLDLICLNLPNAGDLIKKIETARLSRALELLLKGGMQILPAMKIAIPVVGNEVMKTDLVFCYESLEQGGYFSEGLKKSKFFSPFVYHMVNVGEESGKLDEAFREIAEWYEKDTAETIQIFTSLLEPTIILVVGFALGLIITAVLMPVFSMNTAVQ